MKGGHEGERWRRRSTAWLGRLVHSLPSPLLDLSLSHTYKNRGAYAQAAPNQQPLVNVESARTCTT
eukprot:6190997-Pleurochrysis_carterae.AAC.2